MEIFVLAQNKAKKAAKRGAEEAEVEVSSLLLSKHRSSTSSSCFSSFSFSPEAKSKILTVASEAATRMYLLLLSKIAQFEEQRPISI